MPIYSLIEKSTGKETEINCSYNELEARILSTVVTEG